MFETLLSGLVVAIITALAILAYRHPAGYRRIITYVGIVCFPNIVLYTLYKIGSLYGWIKYLGEEAVKTQGDKVEFYKFTIESLNRDITTLKWIFIIAVVSIVYCIILWFLPKIIDDQLKMNPKKSNPKNETRISKPKHKKRRSNKVL